LYSIEIRLQAKMTVKPQELVEEEGEVTIWMEAALLTWEEK
jgi:hypothetical protein